MMTEVELKLTKTIADLAQGLGLLAHWCPESRKCYGHRGLPDLLIAGPHGMIFAEIKDVGGRLHGGQWTWHDMLTRSGQRTFTWRPCDWHDGTIEAEIRAIA